MTELTLTLTRDTDDGATTLGVLTCGVSAMPPCPSTLSRSY